MRQPRWPPAAGAERGRTDEVDRADCAAHPGLPSIPREAAAHSIKTRPASQKGSIDRSDALRKRRKDALSMPRMSGARRLSHSSPRPGQRTSNAMSRTRVRTAETSREPRQPRRLEKRKNTTLRCPEGRTSNPADCALCHHDPLHCTRSGDAVAPGSLRTVITAPVGWPGDVPFHPAAESSVGTLARRARPRPG